MGNLTMYDAIDLTQIPADAAIIAGYVGGRWPTAREIPRRFPHARMLTIAISASEDADCLDIETGDATPADAAGWYERQRKRGITRPCLYASASVMQRDVVPVIHAAGIARASVRLWSAHYGAGEHICGPRSCGLTGIDMDGTQWTDRAMGRTLDASLLAADFFAAPPAPDWQVLMMNRLPVLKLGDQDQPGQILFVRRAQRLTSGIGAWNGLGAVTQLAEDGDFGPATEAAVKRVQEFFGVTQDGVVGPATWCLLVTGSKP